MKATQVFSRVCGSVLMTVFLAGFAIVPASAFANTHVKSGSNSATHAHSLDSKVSSGEGKEMELKFPEPLPPMNRKAAPQGPELRSNLIRGL